MAGERTFEDRPAQRKDMPLHCALLGPQKSGKTWSALELAVGMQKVFGGDVFLIDTEGGRGEHYSDFFKYRYVAFPPPHNALAYLKAIDHCVQHGAGVVIVDSMVHEHSGEGGLLLTIDKTLNEWCGNPEGLTGTDLKRVEACRHKRQALASIRPKAERARLSLAIEQYGPKLNGIFTYRAKTKLKFKTGEEPKELGWQPDTTSPLFYAMTVTFLLPPFSNGVPTWSPETEAERLYLSLPQQFRGWFQPGMRLSAEVGERMARWAKGESFDAEAARAAPPPGTTGQADPRAAAIEAAKAAFRRLTTKEERADAAARHWGGLTDWTGITKLDPAAIMAGAASLARELDGLAALQAEPPEPEPAPERLPGED